MFLVHLGFVSHTGFCVDGIHFGFSVDLLCDPPKGLRRSENRLGLVKLNTSFTRQKLQEPSRFLNRMGSLSPHLLQTNVFFFFFLAILTYSVIAATGYVFLVSIE